MKGVVLTLFATCGLGAIFLAFLCFSQLGLQENDLILRSGFLTQAPVVVNGEHGQVVGLHLYLRGYAKPLSIQKNLLSRTSERVFSLKKGDEILFHEKHPDDRHWADRYFEGDQRPIFSLSTLQQSYLNAKEGIKAIPSAQIRLTTSFFSLIGIAFFILFGRKSNLLTI